MIAIPSLDHPANAFALAVTRLTEVGLGIICASVVHDVLFPRHAGRQVMSTVQARYTRFVAFCDDVLARRLAPDEVELNHLRFAADIAALESGRAAAFFEAAHARAHTRELHAFNNAFMTALTTLYTLHRLMQRADRAEQPNRIDADTAAELRERFARDMAAFTTLYQGLAQQKRVQVSDPVAYQPKTPAMIVAGSGLRAACAVLAGAAIWYWLDWPYLGTSIVMTIVFSALASSSPRPNAMIKGVLTGFLVAAPLAFLTEFLVVIRADDYPTLVLAALPIFALGCYLTTLPKHAGTGIGVTLFAAQVVAPLNQMHYDGAAFLSTELALIAGVMLAYVIFAVILPEHTMGQKDHVAAALWREALDTCKAPLSRLKHRYDHRVRDLLAQLNAASGPAPGEAARAVVRQGLTLLELGHAVIELRQLLASSQAGPVRNALQLCVDELAGYFRAPSQNSADRVLYVVLQAGATIRVDLPDASPERRIRLHTALADLHSIYTSLLDQQPPKQGIPDHAA